MTRPSAAARGSAAKTMDCVKYDEGVKRASSRRPMVTATEGGASKYVSGDSPESVRVTSRPIGRTHSAAFSEAHRQERAVRGLYSGSYQPSSTASIGVPGLCKSNCSNATGVDVVDPPDGRADTSSGR